MATITRGTTPTISIEVEEDLTDFTCRLSIGKIGTPYVTVDNEQMTLSVDDDDVSTCSFTLTQEQTLACVKGGALMQMRAIKDDDAIATETMKVTINDVIESSVISDTYDTEGD